MLSFSPFPVGHPGADPGTSFIYCTELTWRHPDVAMASALPGGVGRPVSAEVDPPGHDVAPP